MLGVPRLSVYATAKAAVIGLTNSLAREFGPDNIRVNAIAPGRGDHRAPAPALDGREGESPTSGHVNASNRTLHAEDVARLALFLSSDDSSMITKQCYQVDGGLR